MQLGTMSDSDDQDCEGARQALTDFGSQIPKRARSSSVELISTSNTISKKVMFFHLCLYLIHLTRVSLGTN